MRRRCNRRSSAWRCSREELKDKQTLLAQQLVRKTEVLALQRSEAALAGELGELTARIADAKERIARAEQQIAQLRSAAAQKTIEELRATETELDDVQEQIRAAQDVVDRIEVRSPVRGIVVKLNQHTPGGVVGAGAVILELLPVNDELDHRGAPQSERDLAREDGAAGAGAAVGAQPAPDAHDRRQGDLPVGRRRRHAISARTKAEQEAPQRPSYVVRVRLDEQDVHSKVAGLPADAGHAGRRLHQDRRAHVLRLHHAARLDSFSRAFRES